MLKLLLVDDHASSREALAYFLEEDDRIEEVLQAGSIAEAVEVYRANQVDAAVIDLLLPDGHGTELVSHLHTSAPKLPLLVLTSSNSRIDFVKALENGASGVLHKSVSAREIATSIMKANAGESIHSLNEVMDLFQHASRNRTAQQITRRLVETLTPREIEVLQALADGLPDQRIADKLSISIRTVQTHIANIVSKLQVDSRLQAVVMATRSGVVRIKTDFDQNEIPPLAL
jgi:DNA-binding NarL/FixJ family response regulator